MKNPIDEFIEVIDEIYGLFLDSNRGFSTILKELVEGQPKTCKQLNLSLDELDKASYIYGEGNPNLPESYILHKCTQGEFKTRNKKGGKNSIIIGNLSTSQIYNYWKDYYRKKISEFLKKENNIDSPIFKDLRYYRQSIIHKRGIAIKEIEKCKILKWHKHDEVIKIDEEKFETIVREVKSFLEELKNGG